MNHRICNHQGRYFIAFDVTDGWLVNLKKISLICNSNASQSCVWNNSELVHSKTMSIVRDFIGVMNGAMLETCDVFKVSSSGKLIWNFHNEADDAKRSNIISLKNFEYHIF